MHQVLMVWMRPFTDGCSHSVGCLGYWAGALTLLFVNRDCVGLYAILILGGHNRPGRQVSARAARRCKLLWIKSTNGHVCGQTLNYHKQDSSPEIFNNIANPIKSKYGSRS